MAAFLQKRKEIAAMSERTIISQGSCFSELAKKSWNALKGKWGITIGTFFVAVFIQTAASYVPVVGPFSGWFLFPLTAGCMLFMLRLLRCEKPLETGVIFEPFNQYWRYVWANLRMNIFIFLWMLLLIIPGIIAGLRYSMTIYIMLDNPRYTAREAMTESCAVMYGHKWQFFGYSLLLSLIIFFGTICTLGIGLFWLIPWSAGFMASFYESVRRPAATVSDDPAQIPPPDAEADTPADGAKVL